jgi:hypothetical protein
MFRPPCTARGSRTSCSQPGNRLYYRIRPGLARSFLGHEGESLFEVGQYEANEVVGTIVHFLACETARELGPDFVRNGCRAFFGHDAIFSYLPQWAATFAECDAAIDLALSSGASAAEAFRQAIERFNDHIHTFQLLGSEYTAAILEVNRDLLRSPSTNICYGDPNATLA